MSLSFLEFPNQSDRLRPLDFLRFLTALFVVIFHAAEVVKYSNPVVRNFLTYFLPVFKLMFYGFFWGSGFFISTMTINEIKKTGSIDIKRFLSRRILRTWPLYFFILAICIFINFDNNFFLENLWKYLTFTQNFSHNPVFFSSWSIAIEEQFYLGILLFALLFNLRFWHVGLFAVLVITILGRLYLGLLHPPYQSNNTLIWLDGLIIGCFVGFLKCNNHKSIGFIYRHANWVSLIAAATFFSFSFFKPKVILIGPFIYPLLSLLTLFPLLSRKHALNRFVDRSYAVGLSNLTYSLYLTHSLYIEFIVRYLERIQKMLGERIGLLAYFFLVLVTGMIVSILIFRLIERPMFKLRDRYFP